jgi:nitrile hydratase
MGKAGNGIRGIDMTDCNFDFTRSWSAAVNPEGHAPIFAAGDLVTISKRSPIGHFRVPNYIRGKQATVESVIEPIAINNEEEGFGRNAGNKRHYYRVAIPLAELWEGYTGSPADGLRIEVFETWLEGKVNIESTQS